MNQTIEKIVNDKQLDNQQQATQLVNILRSEAYYLEDSYLKIRFNDDVFYLTSHPYLKYDPKRQYKDYVSEKIYGLIEHQKTVETIVKAINNIILKTDRLIFIQRFVYNKNIHTIMNLYHISQNYYYQALQCSIEDFFKNLM